MENIRKFRLVKLNEKDVTNSKSVSGKKPKEVADKILLKREIGSVIYIKETTNKSKERVYGPYQKGGNIGTFPFIGRSQYTEVKRQYFPDLQKYIEKIIPDDKVGVIYGDKSKGYHCCYISKLLLLIQDLISNILGNNLIDSYLPKLLVKFIFDQNLFVLLSVMYLHSEINQQAIEIQSRFFNDYMNMKIRDIIINLYTIKRARESNSWSKKPNRQTYLNKSIIAFNKYIAEITPKGDIKYVFDLPNIELVQNKQQIYFTKKYDEIIYNKCSENKCEQISFFPNKNEMKIDMNVTINLLKNYFKNFSVNEMEEILRRIRSSLSS